MHIPLYDPKTVMAFIFVCLVLFAVIRHLYLSKFKIGINDAGWMSVCFVSVMYMLFKI